jgi:hypothetical protein
MQGTRGTIVTAAASFAVVLGVGSVAAATSGHGSHSGSTTGISVPAAQRKPGKATVRAHLQDASTTTETDEDTSTTVDESTTTTVEKKTSTAVRVDAPDTVENAGDDQGDATEEAHENENAELGEHDEKTSIPVADTKDTEVDDHHSDGSLQGGDRSGSGSETHQSGDSGSD